MYCGINDTYILGSAPYGSLVQTGWGIQPNAKMLTFKLNWTRLVQAIDFVAAQSPGLSQFYISKIIYLADKEHLLDYGRPISNDRLVAMKDGPVPSSVLNIVKRDKEHCPKDALELFDARLATRIFGNQFQTYSKGNEDFSELSGSDKEYLADAVERYSRMSYPELYRLVHEDPAYNDAWSRRGDSGSVNMDLRIWLQEFENPELAARQIAEAAVTKA